MSETLRIGIAGLGTVGAGTLHLLNTHYELIAQRCGRPVLVTAVSARDRRKDRGSVWKPCVGSTIRSRSPAIPRSTW